MEAQERSLGKADGQVHLGGMAPGIEDSKCRENPGWLPGLASGGGGAGPWDEDVRVVAGRWQAGVAHPASAGPCVWGVETIPGTLRPHHPHMHRHLLFRILSTVFTQVTSSLLAAWV